MTMKKTNKKLNASITIFLSLSLSIIVSLLFYTLESCHLDALIARSEGITYLSLDSLFGQYCLPLFEDYGLFCLNEQGLDLENEIKKYADYNSRTPSSILKNNSSFLNLTVDNVDITSIKYLTDDDGDPFVSQICDYVKYMELATYAQTLCDNSKISTPEVFTTTEAGSLNMDFNSIDLEKANSMKAYDKNSDSVNDTIVSDIVVSEDFKDNASTCIGHIIKNGLLSFLVDNPKDVSTQTIKKDILPSVTCQLTEDGVAESYDYYKDLSETTIEKAYFCEYIYNTFGCYTSPAEDTYLKYPIEYIINGSDSDDTNLINCCSHIINLRLGCNLVYLFLDEEKYADAKKAAELVNVLPIPGARYIARITILTVWAAAEALLDTRDLLSGKNVPLFKSDENWTLELTDLTTFSKNTVSKNKGEDGLSYKRYLELLLATQNNISLYYRTMDLIQMAICYQYNEDFRLSKCVYSLDVTIQYSLPYLLLSKKTKYKSKGHQRYK